MSTQSWPPPLQQAPNESPPLSPADALKTFYLPPGYAIELVASEPLIQDPAAIDWDLEGRLWAVEMSGYMRNITGANEHDPVGRVVVLQDENGDGRMDRRTVFADRLVLARSVKVLDRGVLVGEPPNAWLMRDTNGDLRMDAKELVTNQYGRLDADPQNNANEFFWALDNWMHITAQDIGLRLKKGAFEARRTLRRGQWGATEDDAGRIYRNTNESALHVDLVPTAYFARNPNLLRTRGSYERLADDNPDLNVVWPVRATPATNRAYQFGILRDDGSLARFTAVCAPVVYRGDRLPADLYGNVFVAEPAANVVSRIVVSDDGATLRARKAYAQGEFLASTDERFRPVYLSSAPDGTLYIVDMYRGILEHRLSMTEFLRDQILTRKLEQPLGMGRIYRVVHETTRRDTAPALSQASAARLVATLSHPNGWWRDTAQRLLVERRLASAIPALTKLAQSAADWRARLHALWTLDGIDAVQPAIVARALEDESRDVRAAALRVSERWLGEPKHPLHAAVLKRLHDADWAVRRQLAASLGVLPARERETAIVSLLEAHAGDPVTLDAALSGLRGREAAVLERLLRSGSEPTTQREASITMLAATIVRSAQEDAIQDLFAHIADGSRVPWQRSALVAGLEVALLGAVMPGTTAPRVAAAATTGPVPCPTCPGGRGGPGGNYAFQRPEPPPPDPAARGGGRGGQRLQLNREPVALTRLSASDQLAARVAAVLARVSWPGNPGDAAPPPSLNADEQRRFDAGREIYRNICQGCHLADGRGQDRIAPTLIGAAFTLGPAEIPARILLNGKEGAFGLMPPIGSMMTDEQIASVLTYVRREWGQAAAAVDTDTVKRVRATSIGRRRPWTDDELITLAGRDKPVAGVELDRIRFNRDIRPIMSDTCFRCHGPDGSARKANMRLDIREDAIKPTRSGRIPIVPGDPDGSEIIRRIFATGATIMPPAYAHKELTAAQKDTIRQWVAEGAVYEGHWAYQPVTRPAIPALADTARVRNPVDHFIQDRLTREGLAPSPAADKRTLLRRVTLDLTGLLPTPEEMRAFLADTAPDAYDTVVERLLSSPRYAEQRTMRWLDAIRYADTAGFHGDNPLPAWPYRDYVLQAFQQNKPFDAFTREQIAGDQLPGATIEQRVASAYNRLNRTSAEGGLQPKEYLAKYGADRVRAVSAVWLGSTLGCAECHDHKFDPFLAKDFYAMKAFFADIQETGLVPDRGARAWGAKLALPSEAQQAALAEIDQALAAARSRLDETAAKLAGEEEARESGIKARWQAGELAWTWQRPAGARALNGATLTIYDKELIENNFAIDGSLKTETKPGDGLVVATGKNPDRETYVVALKPGAGTWHQLGIEVVQDESLSGARYARGADRFLLSEVEAELIEHGAPARRLRFTMATVNDTPPAVSAINDPGMPPLAAIDGRLETAWGIRFGEARNPFLALRFAERVPTTADATIVVTLRHASELRRAVVGRFRLALAADAFAWPPTAEAGRRARSGDPSGRTTWASGLSEDVMRALRRPAEDRDDTERTAVRDYVIFSHPQLVDLHREVQLLDARRGLLVASIPQVVTTVATDPAVTRILPRANWMDDSGPIVEPAIPRFLGALDTKGERATRRDLANWLVSRDNPLTARTFVNRTWREFFGTGLSKVLDDLGSQGEWPAHPELLDWLASEFMHPAFNAASTHDWDVKHIIRLMVTSHTYRQSSQVAAQADEKDRENRLLARQNRFRVDAENVRDVALQVSGLLVHKIGGPSVNPVQPDGYLAALNFPKREYSASHGEDLYRRGLYTTWQRTFLHPSLLNFDAPTREECAVNRSASNTPLQALDLLNDPIYVEAARVFAQHAIANGGSMTAQLDWVFDRALNRAPTDEERAILRGLYERNLKRFAADPAAARAFLAEGESPLPAKVDAVRLAAMGTITRTVLNLHELITRN